ncbi:hypothetical protein [Microcoleus sp. bin38.metabat.b11b12b14.051]|uniref:hypothetical protein n=1 Tax=Microcoleus sp. bin38.metabat.b11b12b14.051 TaxID=2742709 RepID=UPI0025D6550F|nr:hypothetical protein [Microcoleus sp. bin38.metabat.b11b12b14.051]
MFNTILTQQRQILGTFPSREAAGKALDYLVFSGFPLARVFLLGEGCEKRENSLNLPPESLGAIAGTATGLKKGMLLGNLFGGATGLILGAGLLALPGVGQVMLSGAIGFTLLSGGICTAAGGLAGALIGLGLTSEQAKAYQQQISQGSVLLIVEGSGQEVDRAKYLFAQSIG